MQDYKIKQIPSDFHVTEVLSIPQSSEDSKIHICLLEKSGFRTMDAIFFLENLFDFRETEKIGFSGLKDEDGITVQYISFPRKLSDNEISFANEKFNYSLDRYIKITSFITTENHLEVGKLHGNCFTIKIRNMSREFSEFIASKTDYIFCFINYYGPQRFGLPGGVKNTHCIGKAIIEGDYVLALQELCKQSSPEADKAKAFLNSPADYFSLLDNRLISFYQSAYFSYVWNNVIINSITASHGKAKPMARRPR